MKGKLYGIGVGPGDPELLTLKALNAIKKCGVIAGQKSAFAIAERYIKGKERLESRFAMENDMAKRKEARQIAADQIIAYLQQGKDVGYVTLGDTATYSTYTYLQDIVTSQGFEAEMIPGITSYCAASAALGVALCENDEPLTIIPAKHSVDIDELLDIPGNKVLMKSGKNLAPVLAKLKKRGHEAMIASRVTMEEQKLYRNIDEYKKSPETGYFTIAIVKGRMDHMTLNKALKNIKPVDVAAAKTCIENFDKVAKPIGGLGKLEEMLSCIAAITGSAKINIYKKAVVVYCADNGVVRQGVAQGGQEITTAVAGMLGSDKVSISMMAKSCGADVFGVDVGMVDSVHGLRDRKLMNGTDDITEGPAMSRETAEKAVMVGVEMIKELKEQGYGLIATGEVGIGNTTTSSAICSVLLNRSVAEVTGRGAGLDDEGLSRKTAAIQKAIDVNQPNPSDVMDVLHKLGGLDIAAMAGLYIGGALHRVPIVMDGFISGIAALIAVRLCPAVKGYILPSHGSGEPGTRYLMDNLGFSPIIQAGMRLGEGTGAVALFPLIDMALAVYRDAAKFTDIRIEQYRRMQ